MSEKPPVVGESHVIGAGADTADAMMINMVYRLIETYPGPGGEARAIRLALSAAIVKIHALQMMLNGELATRGEFVQLCEMAFDNTPVQVHALPVGGVPTRGGSA